jgi:archaemetzincin
VIELCLLAGEGVDRSVLELMKEVLLATYEFDRTAIMDFDEPEGTFVPKREQHDSAATLKSVLAAAPPACGRVLGVTRKDLCTPVLSFVFGQAQLGGLGAVVSLARLRQEFYGMRPDPSLFLERACKEGVHEIGHTFGLTHCAKRECAMSLSTGIREVDFKSMGLCASCRRRVLERGQAMGAGQARSEREEPR